MAQLVSVYQQRRKNTVAVQDMSLDVGILRKEALMSVKEWASFLYVHYVGCQQNGVAQIKVHLPAPKDLD